MAQLGGLTLRPDGRVGIAAQEVSAAPFVLRREGFKVIITPTRPVVPVTPAKLSSGGIAFTVRVTRASAEAPAEFTAARV
jgi:hypothetical protein